MADVFGGISLPVAASGATLADADLGKADPTGFALLSFCVAALRAAGAAEWSRLRRRPAGDTEGVQVVRKAYLQDPEQGTFDNDASLPGLWLWRRQGRQEDATSDYRQETSTFSLLWILPPDEPDKEALRRPFTNAAMKAIAAAIAIGRDPTWVDPDDDDPKAPTLAADDDAIVLPRATSTSPVTLSGASLNGVIGASEMLPRRGVTITTSVAAGAYDIVAPIVVTYIDWLGHEQTASLRLSDTDGGEVATSIFEAQQIVSVAIPAQQLATGSIRVGLTARAGRGSSLHKATGFTMVNLTDWSPHVLTIQVLDAGGSTSQTLRYYGAMATIVGVEQLRRDPAVRAWPIAVAPAGLDADLSIGGEVFSRAEL